MRNLSLVNVLSLIFKHEKKKKLKIFRKLASFYGFKTSNESWGYTEFYEEIELTESI